MPDTLSGGLGGHREVILDDLRRLPLVEPVTDADILTMIGARRLWGAGLGWVDAGLLAAALAAGVGLWTFDGALEAAAERCGLPHRLGD